MAASTATANRAGARLNRAAVVAMAVLMAASMLMAGADAGRPWNDKHHLRGHVHHGAHSPPAPPGFDHGQPMAAPFPPHLGDQPMAAPPPPYFGDGPAASPFTQSLSGRGYEGPEAAPGPSFAAGSPFPCGEAPEAAPSLESGF